MRLIVNADDFGLTSGVNRGIIECHEVGSVTSATLMVSMPAAEEAAELSKAYPGFGVGLHFNLTLGAPLSPLSEVPSLADRQGRFYPRHMAEKRASAGVFNPVEIEKELLAQYKGFLDFGLKPTHIDSHQHIHVFPAVFDVVANFCASHDLPLRIPWVAKQDGWELRRRFRTWVLRKLLKRNVSSWSDRIKMNSGFGSVFDRVSNPDEISLETYKQILQMNNSSPFELMVHPAYIDKELKKLTNITPYSNRERAVLADARFAEITADLGWELVNYRTTFL